MILQLHPSQCGMCKHKGLELPIYAPRTDVELSMSKVVVDCMMYMHAADTNTCHAPVHS